MSSYPIPCYADMQRAVPADTGAGTSSYNVLGNANQYSDMKFLHISRYGLGRTD